MSSRRRFGWSVLRARVGSGRRDESLQHLGLPPQSVNQQPSPTTAAVQPAANEFPVPREEGPERAPPAAAPSAPPATASAGTPREEMRQKLRKRGQLTPRDTTVSATAGGQQPGAQGGTEERPASLINFKLDQAQPDPERRCEATWQLKRPIQDLPAKLTQLFKRRQWVPSKETRKPRMNDVVLIQQGTEQQKQAIGKAGRIVQDDSSKDGQRFRVKLVASEDPFGEIEGKLQELRSKIIEAKRAIGAASRDEKPALEVEHQQLIDKQNSLQGPVQGHFKPSDLTLLDEEHASHFALAGPNSHCVASIVVDCRGEDSDGSFTRACAELKKAAQAAANDAQRLKAQNDFLLSVMQLSTFWMPFDAAAFTQEADAAEEEVVAAETKLLRAFETDVTVFPPAGQYAATVLTLGEVGLTLELRFKRCLLCRADVFTRSSQPFVAPSGMLASNPDQGSSQSSWEAAAPASGGYASLDYGDHDHPCYQREGCGTCVHRHCQARRPGSGRVASKAESCLALLAAATELRRLGPLGPALAPPRPAWVLQCSRRAVECLQGASKSVDRTASRHAGASAALR